MFDVRPEQTQHELFDMDRLLMGDPTLARPTDPGTSHAAAVSLSESAKEASERFVLHVLKTRGPLTDEMIQSVAEMHGEPFSPSRLRTARKQLVDKGLVRDNGTLGRTDSGRAAKEWAA